MVAFLSGHLEFPFPSPVLFRQLGDRFRKAVVSFSDANDIPWIKFGKDQAVAPPPVTHSYIAGRQSEEWAFWRPGGSPRVRSSPRV